MKIAFFGLDKEEQALFEGSLGGEELSFIDGKLDESNAGQAKDAEAICVFVDSTVNRAVIDKLPRLRYIAARSTGVDNIDCEYAKSKGIAVSNVPGYGSHTVAEFAFGLILNLTRKIIPANNFLRQSLHLEYFPELEGADLFGKTLGVVGTGRIGKNMIKIAKGFGMNVVACDSYPDAKFAEENGFAYQSLEEVMAAADILTLHAPYTEENYHLINHGNLSKMKRGALIINTARGELIDADALIWALKEGILGGAGLDVLEDERGFKSGKTNHVILEDKELIRMPQVIITPHMAFYTREAVAEILEITISNIKAFTQGKPENLVK